MASYESMQATWGVRPSTQARGVAVPEPLRALVAHAYVVEAEAGHEASIVPDGAVDLVASLGDMRGVFCAAPARAAQRHRMEGRVRLVGLSLRPGAGGVLGPAVGEIPEAWIPLGEIAREARGIDARDADDALAALCSFVVARAARAPLDVRLTRAVALVESSGGAARVPALCRAAGASERTLLRLFDRHVGLSPKELARIVRLQRALAGLARGAPLARVAHDAGYADHAHMTHDFAALAGESPSRLREDLRAPRA